MTTNKTSTDPNRLFTDSEIVWLDGSETFAGLTASEILVCEFLAEEGPARSTTVQRQVPIARRSVRRALASLKTDGLVSPALAVSPWKGVSLIAPAAFRCRAKMDSK